MKLSKLLVSWNAKGARRFQITPFNPRIPVVFMHVPKTSGIAVARAVIDATHPRVEFFGFDRSMFGGFTAFDTVDTDVHKQIYLDANTLPSDADFVRAHMAYSTLVQKYRQAQYITVLREPICRTISHWLFWRSFSDKQLRPWGKWADYSSHAREPLGQFLECRDVACQIDNPVVRMLLWPDVLIPPDDFIAESSDNKLLHQALSKLREFSYIDVIENPAFQDNLQAWVGQPGTYAPVNETPRIPTPLRTPLYAELVGNVFDLLKARTRLDHALWMQVVGRRVRCCTPDALREHTLLRTIARHASLM